MRRTLQAMEAAILFVCNYVAITAFMEIPAVGMRTENSVLTVSLTLTAIMAYLFQTTGNRMVTYLPLILYIPVALGESLIGWEFERHYLESEFVMAERSVKEIARMTRFSLESLGSSLSEKEVVMGALIQTAGYIALNLLESTRNLSSELEKRGGNITDGNHVIKEQLKLGGLLTATSTILAASTIWVVNYSMRWIRLQGDGLLRVVPGLIGSLMMIEIIRRILRKEHQERS